MLMELELERKSLDGLRYRRAALHPCGLVDTFRISQLSPALALHGNRRVCVLRLTAFVIS